jgi:ribosomal protein S18 acetylase RimI-like enzyme
MIDIRLATAEDVASLPAIESAACSLFDQIPATAALPLLLTSLEDFEEAQHRSFLWIAEAASEGPVGFALGERLDGSLHLEELDVLPAFGRQGIGARLVDALCDGARARGIAAVTLCTFRDIPWNAPFYERLGFRILNEDELTPGLAARVREEEMGGLPRELRVVMRRELPGKEDHKSSDR